ncbi:MAG: Holliday junction branch migration DNA helicase RuvB [Planctomycetota bacterium]|jgi:Holliday junction DNA helicase RuvB
MARERIVTPASTASDPDDASSPDPPRSGGEVTTPALRPTDLEHFVGQGELVERLGIAISAARGRSEPLEHVLLHGPPGLGKTTAAHVIGNEMGTRTWLTSGPALTKAGDLVGTLTRMETGDVLFIDEIHRLPVAVEEYIYSAMEDYRIDFTLDGGLHGRVVTYQLQPFTLVGATTRAGLLSGPLRSRFGIVHHLDFYAPEDLVAILRAAAGRLGLEQVEPAGLDAIATRSRGTPRIALRLLRRVRDFAAVRRGGRIDAEAVAEALALEGVDELGLDELDRAYLRTIADVHGGGPVGVEAIAAALDEDAGTFEDMVEPYLLRRGFLARTRQGRRLTEAGARVVGRELPAEGRGSLFPGD